ncbi:insulinase family protein [Mariniphaga sediminis]|uniref:Insulinase family protein n=1 Tax=Mariniphaga sediminis TaxID=1628158 RepID=A0A399CZ78_9BACT|nr:M16 family metallopeptidase [Mariniphaga sediminis]RIH64268.1 insulinase family protein [Mariniphaga sediminis]RIH66547.1 insulinase family protein [Mariniphaga sediminis]
MKNILVVTFLAFSLLSGAQQDFDLNDPIPIDSRISKGVLENGLTYYVRANSEPRNRAELMLVVRAGSIDEDDDQKGLAHFAEHMAFNGTENFPKNELIKYFESIGMEFGPEINAYTSFDETVYMLKVPLDSALYMEKGLQVLYDWACQVTDSDEEIEKERGVIREELRGGRNANFRMQQEWLPVFLHNSKYANRLPIGEVDIIENAPPKALRRFRNDWYRPGLQAVIVVGDFDQDVMVEKVKAKFSQIPVADNLREKEFFGIPPHKETLVSIATDKEAQYPVAYVFYKHPLEKAKTIGDYRKSILHSLYNSMINSRLSEKTQEAEPPFIIGQSSFSELFGPVSVYQSVAVCNNGKIEEGLEAVLLENERVKKFGFTQTELERQKTALLNYIEKAYNERDKQKSIGYAGEYKRNFLMTEEPIPGIEREFEYFKTFLPGISLDEVNQLAEKWVIGENRVVVITAPEIEGVKVPSKEEVLALLQEVEQSEIELYEDVVSDVPLVAEEPWPSSVVEKKNLEKVEAVEWTLQNGAKVIIKTTDFKEDEILFSAWSPGGTSLYGQKDDVSADFAATIMAMSGIAGFDKITLNKMLSDKVFNLSPYISQLREGFSGNSSVKDLETLLQVVYLYFTEPRFDETSYQAYMTRLNGVLQNKAASPEAVFQDTLKSVMANYHKRARPMSVDLLDEADLQRMKAIGQERFRNAADFNFFFVGNIDTATLRPLVEKYIGGIPYFDEKENWKDLGIEAPQGVVKKTVKRGQEDKSIQYIVFHGDFEYSSANAIELDALGRILSTRLLEVIREDKSSVYSISARPSSSKYPDEEYTVSIRYGTDPQKLEELEEAVFDEIKDFIQHGPSEEELAKAKEKMLREREIALRENGFWLSVLSNTYYLKEGDFSGFGTYNDLVNSLTIESMQKAFKKYFDFENYISVALEPAEASEN